MKSQTNRSPIADILYESSFTAGIGGSFVALVFLLLDGLAGRPFYTPSLIGQVLLFGTPVHSVTSISLKAVAYYTPVHFFAFFLVGITGAVLVRTMEAHAQRPFWVMLVLFGMTEGGYLLVTHYILTGVGAMLDEPRVAGVNFFAAILMVAFLHHSRRVESSIRERPMEPASSTVH